MVERCIGMGLAGIDSYEVTVEADISSGLPTFDIVGLPDAAVKESRHKSLLCAPIQLIRKRYKRKPKTVWFAAFSPREKALKAPLHELRTG